jgi:hypothetical protein
MDEYAIEEYEYGDAHPSFIMLLELKGGDRTVVGFCEQQCDDNADTLRQFVTDHPTFFDLIQPIIDDDPEWADGEIFFHRIENDEDMIEVECKTLVARSEGRLTYKTVISLDTYKEFVQLVEPIAMLMTKGGECPLNI